MNEKRALIAMSGGVDSSVAACLMKRSGYQCIGATMRLFDNSILEDGQESTCCSLDDVEDARSVAYRLNIPHYVFNFTDDFREKVMDKFVHCYECGATPNPCIDCNRYLKFEHLLRRGLELGCDYVVTGHYAQIRQDATTGRYLMYKAADLAKDQTYFLYSLTQEQLAHTCFPLGGLTKEQVRQIAQEENFINAKKHDSQDICFVPDGDYRAFLERYTGKSYPDGNFLDRSGKVVGRHQGAVGYTLGQRKGLGLAMGEPVYVCGKNMEENTVTVGPNEALFRKGLRANDWNWFPFPELSEPIRVKAKTRSRMVEQSATVYPEENGFARVEFDEPQRAITPGQAVVLYDGNLVVGGGTIIEVL
ncbi:MAG: tRNA 2-thiouridine(34) synthase MnmA [Oscillospiraceae bacterium]|nr:tRNA 2-thiouridine(34) synthase MnmA [Oscillospiraceae bacterium]